MANLLQSLNFLGSTRMAVASGYTTAAAAVYMRFAALPRRCMGNTTREDVRRFTAMTEPVVSYDEVKKIAENPREDVLLVDVRNPDEHAKGQIPNSTLIPLHELPSALSLSPEEFEATFGIRKPSPETRLVFFCRSGVRSSGAVELAKAAGYKNVQNYLGSYLDWAARRNEPLHRQPDHLD